MREGINTNNNSSNLGKADEKITIDEIQVGELKVLPEALNDAREAAKAMIARVKFLENNLIDENRDLTEKLLKNSQLATPAVMEELESRLLEGSKIVKERAEESKNNDIFSEEQIVDSQEQEKIIDPSHKKWIGFFEKNIEGFSSLKEEDRKELKEEYMNSIDGKSEEVVKSIHSRIVFKALQLNKKRKSENKY